MSSKEHQPKQLSHTPAQDGRYERTFANKIHKFKEEVWGQPATKRNFDCYGFVENGTEKKFVYLDQKRGEDIAQAELNQLLLPGYVFEFGPESFVNPDDKVVVLSPSDLEKRGGVLAALQLIALTYEEKGFELNVLETIVEIAQIVPRLWAEYRAKERMYQQKAEELSGVSEEKRNRELADLDEMLSAPPWPNESAGSPKYRKLVFEDASRRVRGSWAQALLWASGFEQAGLSVLSEFESFEEVLKYIALHMTMQEVGMRNGEIFYGDKPIKLDHPFVRPNQSEKFFGYRRPDIYPRETEEFIFSV